MYNLSIIIPHYNSVNSLEKLLITIPYHQTIQVIVVDDNSDANRKEKLQLLKEIKNKNVEFFENDSGVKGAGSCRNIGLEKATGKWVLFADADDFFIDGFFNRIYSYFETKNDVVFFKPTSIETTTGNLSDRHIQFEDLIREFRQHRNNISELKIRFRYVVPWSKLIRRSFIEKYNLRFDEVISANDVMFSTKVGYFMRNFFVSDEIIYCTTKNKGSLTTTITNEIFDSRLKVFIEYYKFLQNKLSKDNFRELNLSGRGYLVNSLKLGFPKLFNVTFKLINNNIRILELKVLNPIWVIKRIYRFKKKEKYKKRFQEIDK